MLRRSIIVSALVVVLGALLTPSASADVLVRPPPDKRCIGKKIKVGVWYQAYSGGPHGVRIRIVAPGGRTVFKKSVRATTKWRYWRVKVKRRGVYRTTFRQGRHGKAAWKMKYRTRVRRC